MSEEASTYQYYSDKHLKFKIDYLGRIIFNHINETQFLGEKKPENKTRVALCLTSWVNYQCGAGTGR